MFGLICQLVCIGVQDYIPLGEQFYSRSGVQEWEPIYQQTYEN